MCSIIHSCMHASLHLYMHALNEQIHKLILFMTTLEIAGCLLCYDVFVTRSTVHILIIKDLHLNLVNSVLRINLILYNIKSIVVLRIRQKTSVGTKFYHMLWSIDKCVIKHVYVFTCWFLSLVPPYENEQHCDIQIIIMGLFFWIMKLHIYFMQSPKK